MRDDWKFMNDRLDFLVSKKDDLLSTGKEVPNELLDEIEHLKIILNRWL